MSKKYNGETLGLDTAGKSTSHFVKTQESELRTQLADINRSTCYILLHRDGKQLIN
jgi:IS1 family transposase